jgi:hypothetical protein
MITLSVRGSAADFHAMPPSSLDERVFSAIPFDVSEQLDAAVFSGRCFPKIQPGERV